MNKLLYTGQGKFEMKLPDGSALEVINPEVITHWVTTTDTSYFLKGSFTELKEGDMFDIPNSIEFEVEITWADHFNGWNPMDIPMGSTTHTEIKVVRLKLKSEPLNVPDRSDKELKQMIQKGAGECYPVSEYANRMADALQKLIYGLAKDGVALEGFVDANNALIEFRKAQVEVVVVKSVCARCGGQGSYTYGYSSPTTVLCPCTINAIIKTPATTLDEYKAILIHEIESELRVCIEQQEQEQDEQFNAGKEEAFTKIKSIIGNLK